MDSNVITALASVQAEIGGIGKKKGGEGGISYAYRGIDAIAAAAQPLLGAAGVVIVPTEAVITNVEQLTVNGKPWTDTFVTVRWTVYGPGGVEDRIEAVTQGVGRDNSDKGYNKAATQAFKNLVLRILCIGDPQDDADQPQHQNNYTDPTPEPMDPDRRAAIDVFEEIRSLGADDKAEFSAWINSLGEHPKVTVDAMQADPAWRQTVWTRVEAIRSGFVPDDPNDPTVPVQTELVPAS